MSEQEIRALFVKWYRKEYDGDEPDRADTDDLFVKWYRKEYDGEEPDWADIDIPLMFMCFDAGHQAGVEGAFSRALEAVRKHRSELLEYSRQEVRDVGYGKDGWTHDAYAAKELAVVLALLKEAKDALLPKREEADDA